MPPTWEEAWAAALDRLERDLVATEELVSSGRATELDPGWEPPSLAGPVPAALAFRAQSILQRQQVVLATIGRELVAARLRSTLGTRMVEDVPGRREGAVYVDVSM